MKQVDEKKVFSVSEVNAIAKETLEYLTFWVEGEISSIQINSNWYYSYITLKDKDNMLPCFLEPNLTLNSEDLLGKKVLAYGLLTLFKKNEYKMHIFRLEYIGEGVLQKEFKKLYQKLRKKGLFSDKYKKPIPNYPKKVCLVTSINSAGWNDFKAHTVAKFPIIDLYSANVKVEGPQAVKELLKILPKIDNLHFDVIVITRGGGAHESLVEVFNDESLTLAIFNLKTPNIVAIGHEINTSLAELAADQRASTPTDAAALITQGYTLIWEKLENLKYQLKLKAGYYFSANSQKLDHHYFTLQKARDNFKDLPYKLEKFNESLSKHEKFLITSSQMKIAELYQILKHRVSMVEKNNEQKLAYLSKQLEILSPLNTLKRGYAVTSSLDDRVIRSINSVVVNSKVKVKLYDGYLISKVLSKEKYDK